MSMFMVLAYYPQMPPQKSPAEAQQISQRYYDWTTRVQQTGRVLRSAKLTTGDWRELRPKGQEVILTEGPFPESKEILGGYWMIEAVSYDEALSIVGDHPHLALGGTLEVRLVEYFS